jgi:hypothetical protein
MIYENKSLPSYKEFISQYESDDHERMCRIYEDITDITVKMNDHRAVIMNSPCRVLSIEFWEHGRSIGYIRYEGKSHNYVESAAENWVTYIMDPSVIGDYSH